MNSPPFFNFPQEQEEDSFPRKDNRTLENALDVMTSFLSQGVILVPEKPSEEMLMAGAKAGKTNIGVVWNIYQAMLNA